jgi:putative zinc finger/helix-turn-helix YgiT family protein
MERSKCELCGTAMVTKKVTLAEPYRYQMSGLDNVFLTGIDVRQCGKCAAQVPVIPKIEQLHKAIAKYLVFKKELLRGKEIRFLRKNAGLAANRFAALLGLDASHLSRVENGKTGNLGAATDKLARAVSIAANDGEDVRGVLLNIADRIMEKKAVFGIKKDHWEKLAA